MKASEVKVGMVVRWPASDVYMKVMKYEEGFAVVKIGVDPAIWVSVSELRRLTKRERGEK